MAARGRECVNFAECRVVISADRVKRQPKIQACSGRCRAAVNARRRQERLAEEIRAAVVAPGPRSGDRARSGAVVSAGRMTDVLVRRLRLTEAGARAVVEAAMSDRQREMWRARRA